MGDVEASLALNELSKYLCRYYGKKVIILLDEYDTPLQEAYVNGYWKKLVGFTRGIFNAAFKTNPWLDRAIMTGITRVVNTFPPNVYRYRIFIMINAVSIKFIRNATFYKPHER